MVQVVQMKLPTMVLFSSSANWNPHCDFGYQRNNPICSQATQACDMYYETQCGGKNLNWTNDMGRTAICFSEILNVPLTLMVKV